MTKNNLQQNLDSKSPDVYKPDFSMRPSPGQEYAQRIVKLQSQQARLKVIARAKALYGVVALSLYYAGSVLFEIVVRHSQVDALTGSLADANAALQVAASGYFVITKDQNMAAQALKILMIVTGIQFFVGSFAYGSLALTLVSLGFQYYAYMQVTALKTTGF